MMERPPKKFLFCSARHARVKFAPLITRHAFTLVELLVVIAIIGLLSSVAVVALSNSRTNARDTKRIADLRQIRLALSMYYNDNGFYPPSGCGYDCNGYTVSYDSSWTTLATALSPYLANLPKDPVNSACPPWTTTSACYSYAYGNVGRTIYPATYDLVTRLETPNHPERCGVKNWKFAKGAFGTELNWCPSYPNELYEFPAAD